MNVVFAERGHRAVAVTFLFTSISSFGIITVHTSEYEPTKEHFQSG